MTSRTELPGRIRALLTAPANVAVHGSPGSGKSWISDRTIAGLDGEASCVVRLDLSTVMSGRDLFEEISNGISEQLQQGSRSSKASTIHESWKSARERISTAGKQTILVLDQFDRVLHFEDGQEFLLLFRELVHRPETLPCTVLILSRRSLQSIEAKVSGISTLASVCYTEFLGSVSVDDIPSFGIPGSGDLSSGDSGECLKWSGGHPALVKYWLTIRPDRNPTRGAELERSKILLRVVDYLGEINLIDAAAQFALGPVIEEMFLERQELELLGVLPYGDQDSPDTVSLSDQEIFRAALRQRTWSLDPWGILGRAEVRLRAAVDSRLSEAYGTDWPTTVAKKSPAIASARREALEKMERDRKMFSRQAPWLSYTYPGDLWTIIQVEWTHFQKVFTKNDKTYWRNVLTGLSQYRAPLAHGRPEVLGEAQRAQCRIFAGEVIEAIRIFETTPAAKKE